MADVRPLRRRCPPQEDMIRAGDDWAEEPYPEFAAGRCAAVDVSYPATGGATAALVIAGDPAFTVIHTERIATLAEVAAYRPGLFSPGNCRRCAPSWPTPAASTFSLSTATSISTRPVAPAWAAMSTPSSACL
jgi:hypothetical protein